MLMSPAMWTGQRMHLPPGPHFEALWYLHMGFAGGLVILKNLLVGRSSCLRPKQPIPLLHDDSSWAGSRSISEEGRPLRAHGQVFATGFAEL